VSLGPAVCDTLSSLRIRPLFRGRRNGASENQRPFDVVFEFADISRPIEFGQRSHRFAGYGADWAACAMRVALNKVLHQQRNILSPLA
jgi:hypothetical protein